eukprot:gene8071-16564_t
MTEEYTAGEMVLALDSGKKYPAKVLKTQICNGKSQYFIHFNGWNKRWDKWVDALGLKKMTDNKIEDKSDISLKATSSVSKEDKPGKRGGIAQSKTKSAENGEEAKDESVDDIEVDEDDKANSTTDISTTTKSLSTKKVSRGSITNDEDTQNRKRRKKLLSDDLVEEAAFEMKGPTQLELDIPIALKKILVDEWE